MKNIIGIPKELKLNEKRVSLIPQDVLLLTNNNLNVYIQSGAGKEALFSDEEYIKSGAIICDTIEDLYDKSNIIVKVKEPQKEEYKFIKNNHKIMTFFHFASNNDLTEAMINSGAKCYAYENIKITDNKGNYNYPILSQMSKIAGEKSMLEAVNFIFRNEIYDYDIRISIFGAGNAGLASMMIAINSGFTNICLLDKNYDKLLELKKKYNVNIYEYNNENIDFLAKNSRIIIGSIYNTGLKSDKLISKDMLDCIIKETIIMDIAIDQGGITDLSEPTTLENPIIKYKNANIYCIPNIPSCIPEHSSKLLSNSIINYVFAVANDNTNIYPELECGKGLVISGGVYY